MSIGFWVAIVVVILVVVLAVWVIWKQREKNDSALAQLRQDHVAQLDSKDSEIRQVLAQNQRDREQEQALFEDRLNHRITQHETERGQLLRWAARGLQWEETSRKHLRDALEALGVDGFLATNVCFMVHSDDGPYIQQIDHLLVAEDLLFVVEAKNWKGRIFHQLRSKAGTDPFGIAALPVFDEVRPGQRYAVKVDESGEMLWRPRASKPEPVRQVQAQSMNLRDHLEAKIENEVGEIFNSVLYCHPQSELIGGMRKLSKYTWVTQPASLVSMLQEMRNERNEGGRNKTVDVELMYKLIDALGADVVGIGACANRWQSPLSLGDREFSSGERA